MTKDSRLLNMNLFQAFMYTDLPLRSIQKTMVHKNLLKQVQNLEGISTSQLVHKDEKKSEEEWLEAVLSEIGGETGQMGDKMEDEDDDADAAAALLERVVLDGFLDSQVDIPVETQPYEINVIPQDMKGKWAK